MVDREKDGWEVVKCYFYDNLTSDSDDEKQMLQARREATSNKKKGVNSKQKDRKSFKMPSSQHYRKSFEFVSRPQAGTGSSFRSHQDGSKVCFSYGKEGNFQCSCAIKRN